MPYLFRLRMTAKVKRLAAELTGAGAWVDAAKGWGAREAELRLSGWSRQRRVVVLRRRLKEPLAVLAGEAADGQFRLGFAEVTAGGELYEYAVLVTSLAADLEIFGQLYRDRGDAENHFDEIKNHWGWGGFTTQDLARCRLLARAETAEQLSDLEKWCRILSRALIKYLHGHVIRPPPGYLPA